MQSAGQIQDEHGAHLLLWQLSVTCKPAWFVDLRQRGQIWTFNAILSTTMKINDRVIHTILS